MKSGSRRGSASASASVCRGKRLKKNENQRAAAPRRSGLGSKERISPNLSALETRWSNRQRVTGSGERNEG